MQLSMGDLLHVPNAGWYLASISAQQVGLFQARQIPNLGQQLGILDTILDSGGIGLKASSSSTRTPALSQRGTPTYLALLMNI